MSLLSHCAEVVPVEVPVRHAVIGEAERDRHQVFSSTVILALALMFVCGLGLRLSGISRIGFSEDEINKLEAVRAYEHGDIRPNAEHPMLMKSLMFVSYEIAKVWNTRFPNNQVSIEAIIRFPNILFGALTIFPLFMLTAALFDRPTGLLASALWTFGINAITYNRIAKEDTLLVFFLLFAFYFYLRAKQSSGYDVKSKRWNYGLSGVSFGLMLASKYFPHYFGLNALYHYLYKVRDPQPGEPSWRTPTFFYLLVVGVFLVANPAVLLPQTWGYLQAYTSGDLLRHSGYLMGDTLYKNNMPSTPFWGTPLYFYLLFLAIKVPIPVIIALLVGLITCMKYWRRPGHGFLLLMFVLWIVPYSLIGAKWLRFTLSLMPFVYMIGAVGIMVPVRWLIPFFNRSANGFLAIASYAIVVLVFMALPAWSAFASKPHYALYTNSFVSESDSGRYFPHDEYYDDGLREAIRFVCETAPRGSTIVHETQGVVRFYLQEFGRTDLQSQVLSDPKFKVDANQDAFFLLQRGRTYFENRDKMEQVRNQFAIIYASCPRVGQASAEVYSKIGGNGLISVCANSNL